MGRPSTRSKNRKHKHPLDQLDSTSEILRKIHASGEITDGDIIQLFNISKPICQGCRVNSKDNPNCFCGLAPSASGSRKSGIWQKTSDFLQALGPDPGSELRDSLDFPAGLTNLGATCYANSILQCLYMNTTFRRAVFSIEADVLGRQPVLDQLARLFGQLFASKRSFIDSAPFIRSLELDNGVQQDSHEFLTLLLSLLERCLRSSENPAVRTVIQDLFRGGVSHVTRCSNCGRDSDASSKVEDFYELELNVLGLKNLDESLDDYLRTEELNGENQYSCEFCKARVDASRSITLRTLPRVLNIQLKRYVFLPKTTTKKKINSSFSFPQQLDMSRRLFDSTQGDFFYDLSAILIHKGTAVNSGHYVAHVKDEKTGIWWEFDDESVSKLGDHPFGEKPSGSSGRPSQTDPVNSLSSSKHATDEAKTDNEDLTQQLSEKFLANAVFSSSDAYLLMYSLQHANLCNSQRYEADDKDVLVEDAFNSSGFIMSLPSYLGDDINSSNESLLQACEKYKSQKEKGLDQISKRKQEVRSILPEAPVQLDEEPFFWVSTNWLHRWVDDFTPPAVDNSSLQCSHGKVPVAAINSMKRLSVIAWSKLFSKYGGGPVLTKNDSCLECLKDAARVLVFGDSYRNRRTSMKEIAESALSGLCSDGRYYVSRPWLQQWVKRKITDAPTEADAGPSSSIRCPHDGLLPEKAAGAKRLLVPENLWLFLREDALNVKPDDPLGCYSFFKDSVHCSQCQEELSEVACFEDSMREMRNLHRQNHEKLAAGKTSALIPYCKYFLLPSSWLSKWRNYVNASGKNMLSSLVPDTLDVTISQVICQKHSRLLERPLEVVLKRGAIFQKISNTDGLTLITEDDWKCFCQEWQFSEENGISAIINYDDDEQEEARPAEQLNVCEEQLQTSDGANVSCTAKKTIIRTSPEVCEDCLGERATSELMQRLNYYNEYISVILIQGKEVPRSVLEASETSFDPCRRISKRSRKTNAGSSINVKVSGSTSIYQLKMMIWESLGIVKENQILCKGLNKIEGDDSTLADCNIFPGDTLWVRDSKIHENRDIADEILEQKLEPQHVEEGFRGSILTTDFSM